MTDQAYTAVTTDTGASIGIATRGIRGYYTLDNMPEFETYPEAQDYADVLNTKLGLSTMDAWKIIASTMRVGGSQ